MLEGVSGFFVQCNRVNDFGQRTEGAVETPFHMQYNNLIDCLYKKYSLVD